MSAKNRKLVDYYKEQGGAEDEAPRQNDKTAWIDAEQQARAEEQMRDAPGSVGSGTSEVGKAGKPHGMPSGDARDIHRDKHP